PQQGVVSVPATKSQFEEHYGIYWARKALELDPGHRPAQVLLISLALEKAMERAGVDTPLTEAAPEVARLLAGTSTHLLEDVLERALADKRTAVVLGAVQALGLAGEARLARAQERRQAPLGRALSYPDARVQMAAAEAIIGIPTPEGFPGASRVVKVLSRALGGDGLPRAFVGAGSMETGQRIASLLKQAGFDAVVLTTGAEVVKQAADYGDTTLIVLDASLGENDLPYTLSQLRTQADTSGVAVVLTGSEGQERRLNQWAGNQPRVRVLTPTPLTADLFKAELQPLLADPFQPALTDAERRTMGPKALELLLRIARGEIGGYDLRQAEAALHKALGSDELAPAAANVLALRPGQSNQMALADLVLRDVRTPAARAAAALALRGHLQRFGVLMSPEQIKGLVALAEKVDDPALKEQALRLAAFLRPAPQVEGNRLLQFQPTGPQAKEAPRAEPKNDEPKDDN
ncbi:MAG TPA: hypothetical protein PKC45_05830, partial [Gemmatales bacterium]|nr:hypothetical protein [Gemmatales bacterium]